MIAPHAMRELVEFVYQSVESIDMTPWPGGSTVPGLIIGVNRVAMFREMHRHLVVSTSVFCIAVNEHHDVLRLRWQPGPSIPLTPLRELDLGFVPSGFPLHDQDVPAARTQARVSWTFSR